MFKLIDRLVDKLESKMLFKWLRVMNLLTFLPIGVSSIYLFIIIIIIVIVVVVVIIIIIIMGLSLNLISIVLKISNKNCEV